MANIRRFILVSAAITVALVLGGCSDSKKKRYPPAQQTFAVSGTASKGILIGFNVAAHDFSNGVLNASPRASTVTSSDGTYTLNLPQNLAEQPLLIRITPAASGSVMRCDLSAGCGDGVDFGENLPITDDDFSLDVVVPSVSANSVANVTLLSNLAAQLALEQISSGNSPAAVQTAIAAANSQIANRFGLVGNLATMPVIDLTDRAAVNTALTAGNTAYLQYAALNAAIIQAVRADNNNTVGFINAMTNFITYFLIEGVAGNTSNAAETSYADILAEAQALLIRVQDLDPENPLNLGGLIQSLAAAEHLASIEEPDGHSQGTPSSSAGATALVKAKNMANDLVDLGASIGNSTVQGGTTINAISDEFAMQIEAAELATGNQAAYMLDALATAAAAIDDANRAYGNNNSLESYTSDTGVTVGIALVEEKPVYSVEDTVEVTTDAGVVAIPVTLMAHNRLVLTEPEDLTDTTTEISGDYVVEGTAGSSHLEITIHEGSKILITEFAHTETNQQTAESSTQTLESFDFNFLVTLAQKPMQGTDPLSVDGTLIVSLADVAVADTATPNSETTTVSLGLLSMQFYGEVSNTTGESFNFAMAATGDATGVSFMEGWNTQGPVESGETETAFAGLSASLTFDAKLTGIPSVVKVSYTINRTGLESFSNEVTVRYPGKTFLFNLMVENGEPVNPLRITNQDGVVMTLNDNTVNGESYLDGTITVEGTKYADITEPSIGAVIITFTDGYTVSP